MPFDDKAPLLEALHNYLQQNNLAFHMPGHKGGRGAWPPFRDMLFNSVWQMDLTELPGLDDLHNPRGPLEKAQQLAAKCFGAQHTYFLVNGATGGIQAAVTGLCAEGEKVFVPRHAHRSVFGALVLSGAWPVYLPVKLHPSLRMPVSLDWVRARQIIEHTPDGKLLILVNPTYEGFVDPIQEIVGYAHQKGLLVLADESHGAHFPFAENLPVSALQAGADVVVHGTHKLMGSLTQSAMLHCNAGHQLTRKVGAALQLLQSTSPSYLLMASLDAARAYLNECGPEAIGRTVEMAIEARRKINRIEGISCERKDWRQGEYVSQDPTKLVISAQQIGLAGYQLAAVLLTKYKIQVEMSTGTHVLAMVTIADSEPELSKLVNALERLGGMAIASPGPVHSSPIEWPTIPPVVLSPRTAFQTRGRAVKLEESRGLVSLDMIAPYPPGIPVICPGEVITDQIWQYLTELKNRGGHWQGGSDPTLDTITVADY